MREHLTGWAAVWMAVAYETGCRTESVSVLRWGDVDFERAQLRLKNKGRKKGQTHRMLPVSPALVQTLREEYLRQGRPGLSERVLPVSESTARVSILRYLKRACAEAGVQRFTPHGLRRAAVDRFRRAGVDVKTAATYLDQTPATMLELYARTSPGDLRDAVARVSS